MTTMYENVCGNCVDRIRVDISLTVHSRAIFKIVKLMCNVIKKNQMHTYEMSYKCQLCPTHTFATYIFVHSCHTYPQSF
jgi:tRNA U54 and U55 pseudouridine synthase Pus10